MELLKNVFIFGNRDSLTPDVEFISIKIFPQLQCSLEYEDLFCRTKLHSFIYKIKTILRSKVILQFM